MTNVLVIWFRVVRQYPKVVEKNMKYLFYIIRKCYSFFESKRKGDLLQHNRRNRNELALAILCIEGRCIYAF